MNFDKFLGALGLPTGLAGAPWLDQRLTSAVGYSEFAARFAGCVFRRGLYRVHDATSGPAAESMIKEAFPAYAGRVAPFGYDWLGRQFAVDLGRQEESESLVLLLEPGTGQALLVPQTFVGFHEEELVEYQDSALASEFFTGWARENSEVLPLAADRCAGYEVPLFLGGSDTIDNLACVDIAVYWSLCGQLFAGTQGLPPRTTITDVEIA